MMYSLPDKPLPAIPYQRALLHHANGVETLVLQTKVGQVEGGSLGWVVPVPENPEVAAGTPSAARHLFRSLGAATKPTNISLWPLLLVAALVALVAFVVSDIGDLVKRGRAAGRHPAWKTAGKCSFLAFFIGLLSMTALPAYQGAAVLQDVRAGPYRVQVIASDSSDALVGWLRENGFGYSAAHLQAFDAHVKRGWKFVAVKFAPDTDDGAGTAFSRGGLVAPLVLRFKSSEPVYPLALTSLSKTPVEILLYTLSERRLDAVDRLPLRHAEAGNSIDLAGFLRDLQPKGLAPDAGAKAVWLSKFSGVLEPAAMREDLLLRTAKTQEPQHEYEFNALSWLSLAYFAGAGFVAWLASLLSAPWGAYLLNALFVSPPVGFLLLAEPAWQKFKARRAARQQRPHV
jgi:hypothetical protein